MRVSEAAEKQLAAGFASIIEQYRLPGPFDSQVLDEASLAAQRFSFQGDLGWQHDRRDALDIPFVTLDPMSSTDLDQAFFIDSEGDELVLYYALADVGAFAVSGGLIEQEAWNRGVTIYGLSSKIPLYPTAISQQGASLLPDGPRPAVLVVVAIAPDGKVSFRSIDRAVCRSRAKLAYDTVKLESIPFLEEFARRMWKDEVARGAIRVDFPQQEVVADSDAPGGVRLELRSRMESELVNSTMSLAVNMALGELLKQARVGVFRVMDEPDPRAMDRLRRAAHALKIDWLANETLRDLQRRLDPNNVIHQRFLMEARRTGQRAHYELYRDGHTPWHSAIGATYVHATAPMRRLADRYVLELSLLIARNESVPPSMMQLLEKLPQTMERSESRASLVERAVIDLIEAVSLQNRIGEILEAEVVDAEAGIVQTIDSAIRSRATMLHSVENGQKIRVRIDEADPVNRKVRLTAI